VRLITSGEASRHRRPRLCESCNQRTGETPGPLSSEDQRALPASERGIYSAPGRGRTEVRAPIGFRRWRSGEAAPYRRDRRMNCAAPRIPAPRENVFSHSHARSVLSQREWRRPRRFQRSGTGLPPVRIAQPTHGRDAGETPVPLPSGLPKSSESGSAKGAHHTSPAQRAGESKGRGQSAESAFHFNPRHTARGIRSHGLAATAGIHPGKL